MNQNRFWSSQPVQLEELQFPTGPIQDRVEPDLLPSEPSLLPIGYSWSDLDLNRDQELQELCIFLNQNYLEDKSGTFGTLYDLDFITWALKTPSSKSNYQIRVLNRLKIVGFISGTPIEIRIGQEYVQAILINFLCIHKKLRGKRLSPVLIRELSRRTRRDGFNHAFFSSGTKLSKPLTISRCFHRDLDPRKLVTTGFTPLGSEYRLSTYVESQRLHSSQFKFRPIRVEDIEIVTWKLNSYLESFSVAQYFSPSLVAHQFLNRFCFVHEKEGEITDMVSFYLVESSIKDSDRYSKLTEAQLFYYFNNCLSRVQLLEEALLLAKNSGADVFTAPDLIPAEELFQLKFKPGNGQLHYYLGNWSLTVEKEKLHFFVY